MKKFGKKRLTIMCVLTAVTVSLFAVCMVTFAKEREFTAQEKQTAIINSHAAIGKTVSKIVESVDLVEANTKAEPEAATEPEEIYEEYVEAQEQVEDECFYAGDDITQAMADQYNLGTGIYGFSSRDAYVLACCVSAEVGDQDYDCLLAVANVIIHRGISLGNCPGAIEEAVYQPYQFEVAYNSMQDFLANGPQENAIAATQDALNGADNVPGYKHFCYYTIMDGYLDCDGGMLLGSEWFYY